MAIIRQSRTDGVALEGGLGPVATDEGPIPGLGQWRSHSNASLAAIAPYVIAENEES